MIIASGIVDFSDPEPQTLTMGVAGVYAIYRLSLHCTDGAWSGGAGSALLDVGKLIVLDIPRTVPAMGAGSVFSYPFSVEVRPALQGPLSIQLVRADRFSAAVLDGQGEVLIEPELLSPVAGLGRIIIEGIDLN